MVFEIVYYSNLKRVCARLRYFSIQHRHSIELSRIGTRWLDVPEIVRGLINDRLYAL